MKTTERTKGQTEKPGSNNTPQLPASLALESFFSNLCKCPEKGNEISISLCTGQLSLGFFCLGKMPLKAEQQDDVFPESSRSLRKVFNR